MGEGSNPFRCMPYPMVNSKKRFRAQAVSCTTARLEFLFSSTYPDRLRDASCPMPVRYGDNLPRVKATGAEDSHTALSVFSTMVIFVTVLVYPLKDGALTTSFKGPVRTAL
jgi:hypothetical protein